MNLTFLARQSEYNKDTIEKIGKHIGIKKYNVELIPSYKENLIAESNLVVTFGKAASMLVKSIANRKNTDYKVVQFPSIPQLKTDKEAARAGRERLEELKSLVENFEKLTQKKGIEEKDEDSIVVHKDLNLDELVLKMINEKSDLKLKVNKHNKTILVGSKKPEDAEFDFFLSFSEVSKIYGTMKVLGVEEVIIDLNKTTTNSGS